VRSSLRGVTLHLIAEDLESHDWYERLFVRTIADVEAYVGVHAEFDEVVAELEDERAND
jgi:hypothetical protein